MTIDPIIFLLFSRIKHPATADQKYGVCQFLHKIICKKGPIMKAEIWTKTACPYCDKAKAILNRLNIPFDEYKISAGFGEAARQPGVFYTTKAALLERLPTAKTVPQIWIDGRHIGGCDDLVAAVKNGEIGSNNSPK
jgi:glutaredoxin 3